jgi:peptide-methionine (R)-S-oxide reductase
MGYQVEKTDEEWRQELTPEEYAVLRQAGTERPFVGEDTDTETRGVYRCKACRAELFESGTKFHSGCGWPSFYQPITDTVEYIEDTTLGMKRVEVRCASCGSHLGHVFPDGYGTPTGDRFCINSISLTLEPAGGRSAPTESERSTATSSEASSLASSHQPAES